jgi:hypothetical protein
VNAKQQLRKLYPRTMQRLESCRVAYTVHATSRHYKIRIDHLPAALVMARTPSDRRADLNAAAVVRRFLKDRATPDRSAPC